MEVSPEHFYGPICNHQLLALNGSMWALSRHKENMHVGSTNQFGKVCIMGSFGDDVLLRGYEQLMVAQVDWYTDFHFPFLRWWIDDLCL